MRTVISKDSTTIAYDQSGDGPALILVGGALSVRSDPLFTQLAVLLAEHFTLVKYDRRGRGDSGDTPPYAAEREVEDIEALINETGGSAYVFGISSGAVLALEAASRLPTKVKKLAMYEPPFIIDDSRPPLPADYVAQLNTAITAGRPGDAVDIFMRKAMLLPEEFLVPMRTDPMWAELEKVAHTLAYDGTIMGDTMSGKSVLPQRWASATMPTVVIAGGESDTFFHHGAQALVDILPDAHRRTLEGQTHDVAAEALAPLLTQFFMRGG